MATQRRTWYKGEIIILKFVTVFLGMFQLFCQGSTFLKTYLKKSINFRSTISAVFTQINLRIIIIIIIFIILIPMKNDHV